MSTPLFKLVETLSIPISEENNFYLPPSVYPKGTEAFVFSPQLSTLLFKLAKSELVQTEDEFIDRLFGMALPYPSTIFEANLEEPEARKFLNDVIKLDYSVDGDEVLIKKLCMHVTDQTVPHKHGHYMTNVKSDIQYRVINLYLEGEINGKKRWNGGFVDMMCFKTLEDVMSYQDAYNEFSGETDIMTPEARLLYGPSAAVWDFAALVSKGDKPDFEEILNSFSDNSEHYKQEMAVMSGFVQVLVFSADSLLNCKSGVSKKRVPVKPSVKSLLGSKKRKSNVVSIAPVNYQTVLHLTDFEHINKKGELKSRASAHAHTVRAHFKKRKTGTYLWGAHVRGKGKLKKREMYDVNT